MNLIKRYASPERREALCPVTPSHGVVAGYGVEGFRDKVQVSSYDVSFYPIVPTHSFLHPSFDQDMIIEGEYAEFYEKYESIILVTISTISMPEKSEVNFLYKAIELFSSQNDSVGIVIALQNESLNQNNYERSMDNLLWFSNFLFKIKVPYL